jgi:hypothetical protein
LPAEVEMEEETRVSFNTAAAADSSVPRTSNGAGPSSTGNNRKRKAEDIRRIVSGNVLPHINVPIPQSLICVSPFLEEALHLLRLKLSVSSCQLAQSCIAHAQQVITSFELALDEKGGKCMDSFNRLSDNISSFVDSHNPHEYIDADEVAMQIFKGVADPDQYLRDDKRGKREAKSEAFNRDLIVEEACRLFDLAECTFLVR